MLEHIVSVKCSTTIVTLTWSEVMGNTDLKKLDISGIDNLYIKLISGNAEIKRIKCLHS